MTRYEKIRAALDDLTVSEKIALHNDYCDGDDYIYDMGEFDEIMDGRTPSDIAGRIFYGDFNPWHSYFQFNGYANLESFDDWNVDEHVFLSDIANYIDRNEESFGISEIDDILREEEEEEEEEEED